MANPYQQKARQRKWIYWGLIGVLLTVSLMHRKWIVERQATDLQLRETTRGEVELTGSAVRLMLTGSRGLTVPILWSTAIEMQKKHQWSEMQLVVGSITKLQPYFITPWLFQSWNMAFNVAVEFDRPYDKYYYICKGLELMAEGERRNRGSADETIASDDGKPRFPGHPELRHHMGFTYQLKIGNSDEKNTMRCLIELSTIHPSERNPDDFWTTDERGRKQVRADKFNEFSQKYPRLIRRLRDQLRYTNRRDIVTFLDRNRDVPSRFIKGSAVGNTAALEEPRKQFPILPPPLKQTWPKSSEPDLALNNIAEDGLGESFDVFLVCRTWYEYAQMPLPEPTKNLGLLAPDYDRQKFRMPKAMAVQIFRSYPSRAQVYIAETLQSEGWFDDEGWNVPTWADESEGGRDSLQEAIGANAKYDTARAWRRGWERYRQYGIENGLYLLPSEIEKYDRLAEKAREYYKANKKDRLPDLRGDLKEKLGESHAAHMKLVWNEHYRQMCNYDAHINQSEGEMDPLTVQARKLLHQAEHARRFDRADDVAVPLYEEAWPLWIHTCMRYPKFAALSSVMEDAYELNWHYVRISQRSRAHILQPLIMAVRQMAAWPYPSWEDWRRSESGQFLNLPTMIKDARGPLEGIQFYDGPEARPLKEYLLGLTTTMRSAITGTPLIVFPDQQNYMLMRWAQRDQALQPGWKAFITSDAINYVRVRLGLK
jgi:hypothetical protein